MRQLLVGTGNPGKLREITAILGEVPFQLLSLNDLEPIAPPEEYGDSYAANAIAKAQYYSAKTGTYALADDTGLEVNALGGVPGLFSARYAGVDASDEDRRNHLLSELARVANTNRAARFLCAVAVASPDQHLLHVVEGICCGTIIDHARGNGGFGYDPLFVPVGFDQTFSELAQDKKNQISHRGRALMKMKEFLLSSIGESWLA